MLKNNLWVNRYWSIILMLGLVGCARSLSNNEGQLQSYPVPSIESGWIRDGRPIHFDGDNWYPVNDIEVLMDSEVYQIGEYKGAQVFVDKLDTKPYHRLYTKFGKNKFRYFEKKDHD